VGNPLLFGLQCLFSSCAKILGCNGCRPSFTGFPTPSVTDPRGVQILTDLLLVETRGAILEYMGKTRYRLQLTPCLMRDHYGRKLVFLTL